MRFRKSLALVGLIVSVVGSGLALAPARATTTIDPAGPVIRDDSINLSVDPGGDLLTRTSSTAPWTTKTPDTNAFAQTCVGINGAPGGTNNSPRSSIDVLDPGSNVISHSESPVRPGINFFGKYPENNPNKQTRGGPWSTTATLAGNPPGTYTVLTRVTNATKTASDPCVLDIQPAQTQTFVYRPWELTFHDLLGGGDVKFNISPTEFQAKVSGLNGIIATGTSALSAVSYFSLPSGGSIILPADPMTCGANPLSCLPTGAAACDPNNGCTPAAAIVNYEAPNQMVVGVFDLQQLEFAAVAHVPNHTRILASAGRILDQVLKDNMAPALAAATANGLNSLKVLNTAMTLTDVNSEGKATKDTITLLKAVQVVYYAGKPAGANVGGLALEAGLVIASWSYSATPDDHYGFSSEESELVPTLPTVAGLVGGNVQHNVLHLPANCQSGTVTGLPCGSRTTGALNADTAGPAPFATSPTGSLPIYVPVETAGSVRFTDMEFVGYNTLTYVAAQGVVAGVAIGSGVFLGIGAVLFGKTPLPVNLSNVPIIWDHPQSAPVTLAVGTLTSVINTVLPAVLADPDIAALQAWALAYRTQVLAWEAAVQAGTGDPTKPPQPNPPVPPIPPHLPAIPLPPLPVTLP